MSSVVKPEQYYNNTDITQFSTGFFQIVQELPHFFERHYSIHSSQPAYGSFPKPV
jgi:hypothetical protein